MYSQYNSLRLKRRMGALILTFGVNRCYIVSKWAEIFCLAIDDGNLPYCFMSVCAGASDNFRTRDRNMYNQLNHEMVNDETSPEGGKTQAGDILTAPIPGSYGSTPVQEKSIKRFYVPFCGLVFYIMAFFGVFCVYSMRQSLSIAIVAMVNQTTLTEMDIAMTNATDQDECPRDPELEHEGGEFNWDRNEQAIVLAAFYCGYMFTQVLDPVFSISFRHLGDKFRKFPQCLYPRKNNSL